MNEVSEILFIVRQKTVLSKSLEQTG